MPADEADLKFDLLDEEEDAPDENDIARQELHDRFHNQGLIRYFPEDKDPRLDWMNDGVGPTASPHLP